MLCLDGSIYPSVLVHLLSHTVHLVVPMFTGKVGREERLRAMVSPKHKGKPRYLCIYMSVHGVVHMSAHLCVAMFLSTLLHNRCYVSAHMSAHLSAYMPTQMPCRTAVYAHVLEHRFILVRAHANTHILQVT